jgi:predicted transcriptional regulator
MASIPVRLSEEAHQILQGIAEQTGESLQKILSRAVEEYRRKLFLEEANAAFERLLRDKKLWKQEQRERADWAAADSRWEE